VCTHSVLKISELLYTVSPLFRVLNFSKFLLCQDPVEARRLKGVQTAVRQALTAGRKENEAGQRPRDSKEDDSDEDEADFDASMRKQVLEKKVRLANSKGAGVSDQKRGNLFFPFWVSATSVT
jgi:hypothetical protein